MELPKNKALTFEDISVKILLNSVHAYYRALIKVINGCVKVEISLIFWSILILRQFLRKRISFDKNDFDIVTSRLRGDFVIISKWFYENCIFLNSAKFFFFLPVGFNEPFSDLSFNHTIIKYVTEKKDFLDSN